MTESNETKVAEQGNESTRPENEDKDLGAVAEQPDKDSGNEDLSNEKGEESTEGSPAQEKKSGSGSCGCG